MTQRPYRRFLILSSPRSGTHMLQTTLNGNPSIVALSEMFNPDLTKHEAFDANTPEHTILHNHIFCAYPSKIAAVGFILHRSGARFGNWPTLWQRLEADPDLYVISLRRRNLLRRYLSYRIMIEPTTIPPTPKIMQPEELRVEFERHEKEVAAFDLRFARHPLLPVSYEELCLDSAATLQRIQTFLGVPVKLLSPGTTRNHQPQRLTQAIANFDELAEHFASTRWASFFSGNAATAHCSGTITL